MPKFTSQFVTDLKPATSRYSRSDRGLAIEVLPTGTKTWCCWIEKQKHTIGNFPAMTLKEARSEHNKKLLENESLTVQRKVYTLAEFVAGPHTTRAIPLMKRGDDTRKRIDCLYSEMFNSLWPKKISKISRSDIDKIKAEMVAQQRKPGTVKRDASCAIGHRESSLVPQTSGRFLQSADFFTTEHHR